LSEGPVRGTRARAAAEAGRRGEALAARSLRKGGYKILERNLRIGRNEADIVALDPDGETVVVIEVKTRRGTYLPPEVSVDRRKRRHLTRFALRLQERRRYTDRPFRFDVITIVLAPAGPPEIQHYENAFDCEE
jgi:putative endonuclease